MIGTLDIALDSGGHRPVWRATVKQASNPVVWLVGRPADEAAMLIPRVFNLCASAHAEAARRALGLPPGPDADASARQERLRDHAVAVFCDWPVLLGGAADREALKGLAGGLPDTMRALRRHLLGDETDLVGGGVRTLERWLSQGATPTARLLARLHGLLDPAWGRAELPVPEPADIVASLETGRAPEPRETTAADLWRGTPLFSELTAREGMSLFVRMLARLIDLVACLDATGALPGACPRVPAAGIGLVRAARGLLAHRATVSAGVVTDYRVLSPSAWNLAEGGLLGRMLAALPLGDRNPMLARLVLTCVNPCVPVRLRAGAAEVMAHA
ncbi:hypothetical protein [Ancylobacter lacus]|uniref:hypothetical protein n=1 Tax=Ancylobacter lacus TaxID=2579970 RepID=UPI001BCB64A3|nr:hypothetical protein [Ancylobacter lacus]MBS7537524.1 hypothetical protein [Ancylobacter lacus]